MLILTNPRKRIYVMETVSPQYKEVLDSLAANLMADRRARFTALLEQTDGLPFIPRPADSPEAVVEFVA